MQTILLVEDNKILMMANLRVLTRAGYQAVGAADGLEALRLAEQCCPDLILLDMMLPKLDGQQVLCSLKRNPETAQIPVVVLTGLSQKNEHRLCRDGAIAFFEKSQVLENSSLLLKKIEQVLLQSCNIYQNSSVEPDIRNQPIPVTCGA
jgi:CheY-like chemotaxis protein